MLDPEQKHYPFDPQLSLEDGGPSQPVTPPNGLAGNGGNGKPRVQYLRQHSYLPPSSNATLLGSTTDIDIEAQNGQSDVENGVRRIYAGERDAKGDTSSSSSPDRAQDAMSSSVDDSKITWRERFRHFTWAWYTSCMSTGGVAILLHVVPHKFNGIEYIGRVFYILQLMIFAGILSSLIFRFVSFPGTFTRSVTHHVEALFMPTFFIAMATVLSNARIYGGPHCGPWLDTALRVCFWVYAAVTFVTAVAQYQYFFNNKILNLQNMTPGWLLPVFAPMLAGTIAINIAEFQPRHHALPICVCGLVMQFLGFFMFIFLMAMWVCRLVMYSLPPVPTRPGMFIAVGPPSFTAFVIIDLARIASHKLSESGQNVEWLNLFATLTASSILILAVWFIALTLAGLLPQVRVLKFKLAWWALVFPNIGFTIAVITVAEAYDCEWMKWVGTVLVVIMAGMWFLVAARHINAVWSKKIMWPGKDEDA